MIKKKHFKKGVTILLTAAMVFSLVGCSKDNDDSKDKTTADVKQESSQNYDPFGAYEETITCTIGRQTVQNSKLPDGDTYEDNAYMQWVKDRFNAECTNAFEAMGGEDYDRQVSLAIASEDLPDVMLVGKNVLDELVENDLIADLTDSYNNYASPFIKSIYDSYDGRCLDSASYDGKLMALPATNLDGAPSQVWIRQDWLDALDLKVDEDGNSCITREELEMVAKEFVAKDPGKSGNPVGVALSYVMDGGSNLGLAGVAGSFGAYPKLWLNDSEGTVYNGSTTPEMKETLLYLADWFKQGILDPQFGTRTWDDITALMTNGQTGITFGVWHIPDWLLSNVKAMDPKANYSSFALEDENGKINVPHSNAAGNYVVVRKGYDNPELVVKLINLFHDERVNSKTLAQDAPEVEAYETTGVDGNARPLAIEVNSNDSLLNDYHAIVACVNDEITLEEVPTLEAKNMVGHIKRYEENPNTTDVIDWSRYHSRMKGIQLIDTLTKEDKFSWVDPLYLGITETMKSNGANLDKLEEETFIKIIIGELNADGFDKFVESWNSQGGAQICEELKAKQ